MQALRRWSPLLLLLPFAGVLWVPFYNHVDPRVAGFPFFYVWLFGWTILTALLTAIVFALRRGRHR